MATLGPVLSGPLFDPGHVDQVRAALGAKLADTAGVIAEAVSAEAPVDSGRLAASIGAEVRVEPGSIAIAVTGERYGVFVNAKTGFVDRALEKAGPTVLAGLEKAVADVVASLNAAPSSTGG